MSGEDHSITTKAGYPLFDYYTENRTHYDDFGIEKSFNKFITKHGWYFEWHDPGTVMLFKING